MKNKLCSFFLCKGGDNRPTSAGASEGEVQEEPSASTEELAGTGQTVYSRTCYWYKIELCVRLKVGYDYMYLAHVEWNNAVTIRPIWNGVLL